MAHQLIDLETAASSVAALAKQPVDLEKASVLVALSFVDRARREKPPSRAALFTHSAYGDDVEACAPVSPDSVMYHLYKTVRSRPPPGATDAEVINVLRFEGERLGMVSSRALDRAFKEKARADKKRQEMEELEPPELKKRRVVPYWRRNTL